MTNQTHVVKTIRVILKPLNKQKQFLLSKAKAVPKEFRPIYNKGCYPKGSARIVNDAIHKMWKTMRSTKQIPIDKQISKIIREDGILSLKIQSEFIPIRIKEVIDIDDILLHHYRAGVIWLKGNVWVADLAVNVPNHYNEGKPEAVVGIDLGKWHNCYSVWVDGKEIYRAFDQFGDTHLALRKISNAINEVQSTFKGSRKQLKKLLNPLYKKKRLVLRQYYGTLRTKILNHVPEGYNIVFILEDLESLPRSELRKAQRTWANQELANGIFRNAIAWNGYKVVTINPRGTTHTCWKCGALVKSFNNRTIICEKCYPKGLDRDLNAARNIARRYMLSCVPEHSCTGNVRLSSECHVPTVD